MVSFSLLANCHTNQIKIVQESLMLIVILSLSKTKEFVKEILYELFSPKGAYITAEGREYCRNCSHNSIQFASRTMMFVKTCRNLQRCIKIKMIRNIHALIGASSARWGECYSYP